MRRTVLVCAVALLATACGDAESGSTGGGLAGRTFLSQEVTEDGASREIVEGTSISLHFHDDGRFTANAGCNTLLADLTITDDVLEIVGVGMSEMGCDQPLMEQDQWLAGFLEASPTWTLEGDELTLSTAGTEILLLDREVADPDRPLAGTRWEVDSIIHGGDGPDSAVSSMIGGTEGAAWLEIGPDGAFGADSGCRDFQGNAAINNGSVTFSDTVNTDQACTPEFDDIDSRMTRLFAGEFDYEITAARLTLAIENGDGLGFHAADNS